MPQSGRNAYPMRRKRIAALMAGVDQEYQQGFTWGMYRAAREKDIDLCIFNCQGHADGFERDDSGERAIFSLPHLRDLIFTRITKDLGRVDS